ncbi:uncharacterized protein LOC142559299 [Dermacentor variabilis]|uniref:uncharacterized protein LOC142559299 n=1 Tax=Dermacentor variabilis TaxID=34621 RepID=UPI003F5BEE63
MVTTLRPYEGVATIDSRPGDVASPVQQTTEHGYRIGVWLIATAQRRKEQPTPGLAQKSVECLTGALRELANYIDTDSNPCTDFHDYVCNKSGYPDARSAVRQKISNDIISPILQGRLKDERSQLLSAYYSSCVEKAATGKVNVEEATQNMFKVFHSEYDLNTESDVIKLIGMVCIKLGLYMPIYVYAGVDEEDGYAYVGLAPAEPLSTPSFFGTKNRRRIVEDIVRVVQTKIQANFTFRRLHKFHYLAKNMADEESEGSLTGNLSVLDALKASVSFDQWKTYLLEISVSWAGKIQGATKDIRIKLEGPGKMDKLLQLYARPEKRVEALAHLALLSVYTFFMEEINLETNKSAAEYATMCQRNILHYRFLWASVAVDKLRQPQDDALIAGLYKVVISSAFTEMEDIFEEVRSRNLTTLDFKGNMSSFQLMLPGDFTSAYPEQLPRLTRDYWSNAFLMRRLQWKAELVDDVRGFSGLSDIRWDAYADPLIIHGSNVVFLPTFYLLLNSQCQDEKERRLLDALTAGVTIANHFFEWLYYLVFSKNDRGNRLVKNWLLCHRRSVFPAHSEDQMIRYPWLSLRVVQWVAELDWWDGVVMHWSTWTVRPAQIFYALFYSRNLCSRVASTDALNTTSLIMDALPGFSATFQCPALPKVPRDLCLVTATVTSN